MELVAWKILMVRSAEGKLEPKIFFRTKEKYKKLFCKQLDGASITLGAKNIGLTLFKGTFDAKNIGPIYSAYFLLLM